MASTFEGCPDCLYDTRERCHAITIPALIGKAVEEPPAFHPFPLLPFELRWKIWAYLEPGPRIIRVMPKPEQRENRLGPKVPGEYVASPASYGGRHPVLLHINQETRKEALKTLNPLFDCFWNFNTDTLFIDEFFLGGMDEYLDDMRERGLLKKFKHLATNPWPPPEQLPVIRLSPNIETYTVIAGMPQKSSEVDSIVLGVPWSIEYQEKPLFLKDGRISPQSAQYKMDCDIRDHPQEWKERGSTCLAREGRIGNRTTKVDQREEFFWRRVPVSRPPGDRRLPVRE
ncbi:hypothetical protein BDZ45DRAFT_672006 [Acephala macrosclerotiorum]|nr:hypothetical protein BDZ45DRAFT_672006 [Acephala macrosclerotiorum]